MGEQLAKSKTIAPAGNTRFNILVFFGSSHGLESSTVVSCKCKPFLLTRQFKTKFISKNCLGNDLDQAKFAEQNGARSVHII